MKVNTLQKSELKKVLLAATAVIAATALLFQGFTLIAEAAEFRTIESIPTSYTTFTGDSAQNVKISLPEGYRKANYTVGTIDLEFYRTQTPTIMDMTKEEAAEIGAQALWSVFALELEGLKVEMGYQPANENLPRSRWYGDVLIDGIRSYSFSVDSVTGELFSLNHARTLKEKVSLAFDAALDKNPQEYLELAKKLAEKFNIVHGPVKSVEYNGQGYGGNDPSLSVDITGENGEIALLSLSRFDQALLGIGYDASYKYVLNGIERIELELKEKAKEQEESASTTKETTPVLIPYREGSN